MPGSRRHPNRRAPGSLPVELRRTAVGDGVRRWVEAQAGAPVVRVRRLPGASSTAVHGVRLADGTRLVLRRYVWPGYLAAEPEAPVREVEGLRHARRHELPVPEVVAADVGGEATGDGVPALLMSFVPGRAVAAPDLDRLAEVAARIHAVPTGPAGHRWYRWYGWRPRRPPQGASRPKWWEAAIERWWDEPPPYRPGLVHRDLHPGNVLWVRGRVGGVVDWAGACLGPPGCDVAHCRWNLLRLAGEEAADRFTAAYERVTGTAVDPFWELGSVLEHDLDELDAGAIAASERRLERALAALGLLP